MSGAWGSTEYRDEWNRHSACLQGADSLVCGVSINVHTQTQENHNTRCDECTKDKAKGTLSKNNGGIKTVSKEVTFKWRHEDEKKLAR